jgi:hypothetical protein
VAIAPLFRHGVSELYIDMGVRKGQCQVLVSDPEPVSATFHIKAAAMRSTASERGWIGIRRSSLTAQFLSHAHTRSLSCHRRCTYTHEATNLAVSG